MRNYFLGAPPGGKSAQLDITFYGKSTNAIERQANNDASARCLQCGALELEQVMLPLRADVVPLGAVRERLPVLRHQRLLAQQATQLSNAPPL